MPSIAFFSIPADNYTRARHFYEEVFGWKFTLGWEYDAPTGHEQYWEVATGGVPAGLTRREYSEQPIGVGIQVEDLDDYISRLEAAGGKVIVPKNLILHSARIPKVIRSSYSRICSGVLYKLLIIRIMLLAIQT